MSLKNAIPFLEQQLTASFHRNISISGYSTVSGGSINNAYCLQTDSGKIMLKQNDRNAYPGMFTREADGLAAIAATHTIAVPTVIAQDEFGEQSFLLLGWIESRRPTPRASEQLGRELAALHQTHADHFGFDADNYMGSLRQSNKKHQTWSAFFAKERLEPMVKIAFDNGLLNNGDVANFERLYQKLPELFMEEPSSLIHGDLWGGNYLIGTDEKPYLIDPAVSYGHREFDIAMTTLFGGFADRFYEAYNETFTLDPGWQHRLDLWNLYPLLIHLNLFGTGYLGQVRDGLEKYV